MENLHSLSVSTEQSTVETSRVLFCAMMTHRRLPLPHRLRIHHVDGLPLGEGEQLVNGHAIEGFVAVALGVPQVRGAQDIWHLQQWMRCADDRLIFVDVDGRKSGPPLICWPNMINPPSRP